MCGIAGFAGWNHEEQESVTILDSMCDAIRHRGPDDAGVWLDPESGLGLGHRRLSILDLSPAGHQPMHSGTGRYVIVFNGEIYNHHAVRTELESLQPCFWRGHSDTEVLLAAFEKWGVDGTVRRLVGMFSIALWDRKERILFLLRDRLGEKPLYYGWMGGTFLFGSELKALRAHPAWRPEIDRNALALFLRHNYVPSPFSIYKGVRKLPPGTVLALRCGVTEATSAPTPIPYWTVLDAAEYGRMNPFRGTESEAAEHLESLLRDSVRQQMTADVPIGAFLSGGIDSSTIVALMQEQSLQPIKTFTIGFLEDRYDEAKYAKEVARHLGTDHTELYVTAREAMEVIPRLPFLYDEPFSDSSQIPTFLLSRMTRGHVTVSLSGDGGDELFGGYSRYLLGEKIWKGIGWMPVRLRRALASAIRAVSVEKWTNADTLLEPFLPKRHRGRALGDKVHKLAEILLVREPEEFYLGLVSHWKSPTSIVKGAEDLHTALTDRTKWVDLPDFVSRMMFLDTLTYLPDDILVKVDRATMGVSLESRVPLLDHRIVEFVWRIPLFMKIRGNEGKWLLRQVLYKHVPKHLVERPKTGFGVPIDDWLRGPLRDWAESLLDEKRMKSEGFFEPGPIREKWLEHVANKRNWHYYLWDILIFQAWLASQKEEISASVL